MPDVLTSGRHPGQACFFGQLAMCPLADYDIPYGQISKTRIRGTREAADSAQESQEENQEGDQEVAVYYRIYLNGRTGGRVWACWLSGRLWGRIRLCGLYGRCGAWCGWW